MTTTRNMKAAGAWILVLLTVAFALFVPLTAEAASYSATTKSSVKLLSKPSSSGKTLATLKKGAAVTVTGTSGSYSAVKYGSTTGYVKTSSLNIQKPTAALGKIGKIEIPGLVRNKKTVKHDVVIAKDNKYYIDKDPNGKKNVNGSIFMDYRNQDTKRRRNLILYGHNMKDGSMFAALHYYGNAGNPEKYSKVNLTFLGEERVYEVIAAGMIYVKNNNSYIKTSFSSDSEYTKWIGETLGSLTDMKVSNKETYSKFVKSGYTPAAKDQLLTLSTCVPRSGNFSKTHANYKWVVICRMVSTKAA